MIAKSILVGLGCQFEEKSLFSLLNYSWPGNVRQLKNVLLRAAILGNLAIKATLLQQALSQEYEQAPMGFCDPEGLAYWGTLEEIEKRAIQQRLKFCGGNRRQTARELGIAKSTLHYKLRSWKEPPPPPYPLHDYIGDFDLSLPV